LPQPRTNFFLFVGFWGPFLHLTFLFPLSDESPKSGFPRPLFPHGILIRNISFFFFAFFSPKKKGYTFSGCSSSLSLFFKYAGRGFILFPEFPPLFGRLRNFPCVVPFGDESPMKDSPSPTNFRLGRSRFHCRALFFSLSRTILKSVKLPLFFSNFPPFPHGDLGGSAGWSVPVKKYYQFFCRRRRRRFIPSSGGPSPFPELWIHSGQKTGPSSPPPLGAVFFSFSSDCTSSVSLLSFPFRPP